MIQRIVSAVDGSAMSLVALRHGAEIALRSGATLRAVFVEDVKVLESGALLQEPLGERVEAAVAAEAEETLGRARDMVGRLGLQLETAVRRGVVPVVLVEESRGADLLTMGRWGGHALWATGMLGSAVECVVRKVGLPALVASGPFEPPRRVLVPYDGSPGARKALKLAVELAGLLAVRLVLLTVEDNPGEASKLLDEAETQAIEAAPADAAQAPPLGRLVYRGDRAAEIAAEADERTLTLMGAYGHSPLRELILGSVTAQVMRMAKGAVVLCR